MPRYVSGKIAEPSTSVNGRGLQLRPRSLARGHRLQEKREDHSRNSTFKLIELLESRGGQDRVLRSPRLNLRRRRSIPNSAGSSRPIKLGEAALRTMMAVVIATDHDDVDYVATLPNSKTDCNTRNASPARS